VSLPKTTVQVLCMTCNARLTACDLSPEVASQAVDAEAESLGWLLLPPRGPLRWSPVHVCGDCRVEIAALVTETGAASERECCSHGIYLQSHCEPCRIFAKHTGRI